MSNKNNVLTDINATTPNGLRDDFAKYAMQALIAKFDIDSTDFDAIPREAYRIADQMMEEREELWR